MSAILGALDEARAHQRAADDDLARTIKGKGVSFAEGKDGWHGKALKKDDELDEALDELKRQIVPSAASNPPR